MGAIETTGPVVPRVMIAAPHGRSGKTILTLGLLRALRRQGCAVQPFKKGADFIDPGWHTVAAGRTSRNLDRYFMEPDQIRAVVREASAGADVCVVEAAMGLYDGLDAEGSTSSAEIAKITATPVVLVLDVTRMTRTAGALVLGCCAFDPDVRITGVILNRVRGARQRALVTEVIERTCGIPVVGAVPADARLDVPDRHLGLVTSGETDERERLLDGVADVVAEWVDLDAVRAVAASAGELPAAIRDVPRGTTPRMRRARGRPSPSCATRCSRSTIPRTSPRSSARARGSCSCAAWKTTRCRPTGRAVRGRRLPRGVRRAAAGQRGPPTQRARACRSRPSRVRRVRRPHVPGARLVYRGRSYDMAGVLGWTRSCRTGRRRTVTPAPSWATMPARLDPGMVLVGHEHHHSQATDLDPALRFAYAVERGRGIVPGFDGACTGNVVAGYLHVNALASPAWAPSFVRAAERYRARRSAR